MGDMSTTANINFADYKGHVATVWRWADGYPDGLNGVLAAWRRFINVLKTEESMHAYEALYQNCAVLCARYIAWLEGEGQICEVRGGPSTPADVTYQVTMGRDGPQIILIPTPQHLGY